MSLSMDSNRGKKKTDLIRKLLLDTVGKNPELFCYYVSIQEARHLLGQSVEGINNRNKVSKPLRKLTDC